MSSPSVSSPPASNVPTKPSTIVVIPTYNESLNIEALLDAIDATGLPLEPLVVDDGSPDGTADCADRKLRALGRGRVLRRRGVRSYAHSVLEGYRYALAAGHARAIQMDADFSHAPAHLAELLRLAGDADVVIGSRYVTGGAAVAWPWRRRLVSEAGNVYLRALTGLRIRDVTGGFRLYTRRALLAIGLGRVISRGFSFQAEMTLRAHRAGLRIAEFPITFADRRAGASKLTFAMALESLVLPWRLRGERPVPLPAEGAEERDRAA